MSADPIAVAPDPAPADPAALSAALSALVIEADTLIARRRWEWSPAGQARLDLLRSLNPATLSREKIRELMVLTRLSYLHRLRGPCPKGPVLRGIARALALANEEMDADPARFTPGEQGEVAAAGLWLSAQRRRRRAKESKKNATPTPAGVERG